MNLNCAHARISNNLVVVFCYISDRFCHKTFYLQIFFQQKLTKNEIDKCAHFSTNMPMLIEIQRLPTESYLSLNKPTAVSPRTISPIHHCVPLYKVTHLCSPFC